MNKLALITKVPQEPIISKSSFFRKGSTHELTR